MNAIASKSVDTVHSGRQPPQHEAAPTTTSIDLRPRSDGAAHIMPVWCVIGNQKIPHAS